MKKKKPQSPAYHDFRGKGKTPDPDSPKWKGPNPNNANKRRKRRAVKTALGGGKTTKRGNFINASNITVRPQSGSITGMSELER